MARQEESETEREILVRVRFGNVANLSRRLQKLTESNQTGIVFEPVTFPKPNPKYEATGVMISVGTPSITLTSEVHMLDPIADFPGNEIRKSFPPTFVHPDLPIIRVSDTACIVTSRLPLVFGMDLPPRLTKHTSALERVLSELMKTQNTVASEPLEIVFRPQNEGFRSPTTPRRA